MSEYDKANLGSSSRNEKFMRLMGGGSKKPKEASVPHANPVKPLPVEQYVPEESGDLQHEGEAHKSTAEEEFKEIHTANKWESAELGDTGRKNKFLRLMGAGRATDTGQESEAKGERKGYDKNKLEKDLEQQYIQGLEFKRTGGVRQHRGLGFVQETPPEPAPGEEIKPPESAQGTPDKPRRVSRFEPAENRGEFPQTESQSNSSGSYPRDREALPRDRRGFGQFDDHHHGSQRDRDAYRRGERDHERHSADRYGGDRADSRDTPTRDRDHQRWDKQEYKADPSEYGRDNRHRDPFNQGYGYQNEDGNQGHGASGYGTGYQAKAPQGHNQIAFQKAQQPQPQQSHNWMSQPPPPPPPEPSYQAGYQGNSRGGHYGHSGGHSSSQAQAGFSQTGQGAPPPPAYNKYKKPMNFVKSGDS